MSLTSFITIPEIRERLRKEFVIPKMAVEKEIIAPPLTERFALVGTAFDYLLRFYIEKRNPNAISREWIAETAFNHMRAFEKNSKEDGKRSNFTFNNLEDAKRILTRAKDSLKRYLASTTTKTPNSLLENALLLAQIDMLYRAGSNYPGSQKVDKDDIADLRNLINTINPNSFRASKVCLLNPAFGETARMIGGADADLLIDDTIIDIKTTKQLQLLRRDFDQLIGYYILHELDGMNGMRPKPKVKKVAIYFSRFAYLLVFEINKTVDKNRLPIVIDWFASEVKDRFDRKQNNRLTLFNNKEKAPP